MAQINLAPGSQYIAIVRRRRRMLYVTAGLVAISAIIAGIVLSILVARAEKTEQSLNQELQSVESRIAQASEEVRRIQLFESRLTSVKNLLDNHKTWSAYLQEIERLLPLETILTTIQANHSSETINLVGSTISIDRAAESLASLQNQPVTHTTLFTSGTISNVEQTAQVGPAGEILGQRYNFNISLTLNPTALK